MRDLIRALVIFSKYSDEHSPTHCEHDTLYVGVDPSVVSRLDTDELEGLGFYTDREKGVFYSYRFGSY